MHLTSLIKKKVITYFNYFNSLTNKCYFHYDFYLLPKLLITTVYKTTVYKNTNRILRFLVQV